MIGALSRSSLLLVLTSVVLSGQEPLYPAPLFQTSFGAALVAAGDMNEDGFLDVVATGGNGGDIVVVLAEGGGAFAQPLVRTLPVSSFALMVADMDGDGHLDVVAAGSDDRIYVLRGNADGTLQAGMAFVTGPDPWAVTTGDLDGDGRLDVIAVSHTTASVSVLLGTGGGNLAPPVSYPCAQLPYHVATADADGDGDMDVAVASNSSPLGKVSFLAGDGQGGLLSPVVIAAGNSLHSVLILDVNLDGLPDLLTAGVLSDDVSVLLNTGAGGFAAPTAYGAGPYPAFMAVLDADHNGVADIAVCNEFAGRVTLLLGTGAGGFASGISHTVLNAPATLVAADFDGDGQTDVFTGHANGRDRGTLLLGRPGGFRTASSAPTTWASPFAVALGDLNEDGHLDLVTSDYCGVFCGGVSVRLGDGSGAVTAGQSVMTGFGPEDIALADTNLDGHLDAVVATYQSGGFNVLHGNGSGGLAVAQSVATGSGTNHLAVADINHDGFPDVATSNPGSATVVVSLSQGSSFQTGAVLPMGFGSGPGPCAFSDLDGDGHQDLVVALTGFPQVLVFLGTGTGAFGPASVVAAGPSQVLAVADFNEDGIPDLATHASTTLSIHLGNGVGGFIAPLTMSVLDGSGRLRASDLNGDGHVDLAFASYAVLVTLGDGTGHFSAPMAFATGTSPKGLALGDMNADGLPDIVTANQNSQSASILTGQRGHPAGVAPYGTGTPGCFGTLGMTAYPAPRGGALDFVVSCTNAPSLASGFLMIGLAPLVPGLDVFGVGAILEIDPQANPLVFLPMSSDVGGVGKLAFPIPLGVPAGPTFYVQSVWVEAPGLACGPSPYALTSSRGLALTLQP